MLIATITVSSELYYIVSLIKKLQHIEQYIGMHYAEVIEYLQLRLVT